MTGRTEKQPNRAGGAAAGRIRDEVALSSELGQMKRMNNICNVM